MSQIAFRLATPADVDALVNLRARFLAEVAGADASAPELLFALRRYFTAALPGGTFVAFIAAIGSEIVATTGLVYREHPPTAANLSGREAYILNIYTLPQWRKRGIATVLLHKLLEHVRAAGCLRVSLHAVPQARSLYEQLGFAAQDGEMRVVLQPGAAAGS